MEFQASLSFLYYFLGDKVSYVAQACLELMGSSNSPAQASEQLELQGNTPTCS
jgi:hypothetical protein